MASTGGGSVPSPPKRPTVIRKAEGPPVPGRPAPPVPAGRTAPPVPESKPAKKDLDSCNNGFRPAVPPTRPPGMSSSHSVPSQQSKPPEGGGKKRPVITIVSARPMSEVGFRDDKSPAAVKQTDPTPALQPVPSAGLSSSPQPHLPPAPPPKPIPSTQDSVKLSVSETTLKERPPIVSQRPAIPPSVHARNGQPAPIAAVRPQVSPRLSAAPSITHDSDPAPSSQTPPIPHRSFDKEDDTMQDNSETVLNKVDNSVIKRPTIVGRPLPVKAPRVGTSSDSNDTSMAVTDKPDVSNYESVPEVASKPKRPTIIRPGRIVAPKTEKTIEGDNVSNPSVSESLYPKLTPTEEELNSSIHQQGPPPPSKPKPTVLPKPGLAPRPQVAKKPVVQHSPDIDKQASSGESLETSPNLSLDQNSPEIDKPSLVTKRPTIIRPSRPAQSVSSENIGSEKADPDLICKHGRDDIEISTQPSRPQPPLPTKRPVSMTNIPQACADEVSQTQSMKSSHSSSQSSENVSQPEFPAASPRPAVRQRPASMMLPAHRPPPPSVKPRLNVGACPSQSSFSQPRSIEDVNVDPTPTSGQKKKVLGVAVLPQLMKPKTVSLEDLSEQEIATGNLTIQKTVNRPPPPKKPPSAGESPENAKSSSDEEFFPAWNKPERPQGGPPKPQARAVSSADPHSEIRKPARPSLQPPAKKQSISDSPEQDDHSAVLRPKPEGRPSRPTSVPVKVEPPAKPRPPAPGSVKKKTGTPVLPGRPGPGHPLYHYMMQTPHAIALHDYTAKHEDELTFKTGDVLLLLHGVDTEWAMGKLGEQEGILPRGFIKVQIPLPGETVEEADDSSDDSSMDVYFDASPDKPDTLGHGPRCRARFDFDGEGPDDLTFAEGDMIRLLERVGLEWRRGQCEGRLGLFPLAFVEVIEDLPEEGTSQDNSREVTALFDFEGMENELSFQAGEKIQVQYRVNEEWLFGQKGEMTGQFPIQFVDHVPADLPPLSVDITVHSEVTEPQEARQKDTTSPLQTPLEADLPSAHCVALYDYPGPETTDLSFSEGDVIQLLERIDANWLRGSLRGHTGIFPAGFVEIRVDLTDQAPAETETGPVPEMEKPVYGVALHPFVGEGDNELTFETGDQIQLLELVEGAGDWRWGQKDDHRGMFPTAFVEEL